jgi:hypothetical protein
VVTGLRHRYWGVVDVLLAGGANCDAGVVRDAYAPVQQFVAAKRLSALMVLMLLAPVRDASSEFATGGGLPSAACRQWQRAAEAMVKQGRVTESAVLDDVLAFVDAAAARKHLTALGLLVLLQLQVLLY